MSKKNATTELDKIEATIYRLSADQLINAYLMLEFYRWDSILGEKPNGWDKMPNYDNTMFGRFTKRKTKEPIIARCKSIIRLIVGDKVIDEKLRERAAANLKQANQCFIEKRKSELKEKGLYKGG